MQGDPELPQKSTLERWCTRLYWLAMIEMLGLMLLANSLLTVSPWLMVMVNVATPPIVWATWSASRWCRRADAAREGRTYLDWPALRSRARSELLMHVAMALWSLLTLAGNVGLILDGAMWLNLSLLGLGCVVTATSWQLHQGLRLKQQAKTVNFDACVECAHSFASVPNGSRCPGCGLQLDHAVHRAIWAKYGARVNHE